MIIGEKARCDAPVQRWVTPALTPSLSPSWRVISSAVAGDRQEGKKGKIAALFGQRRSFSACFPLVKGENSPHSTPTAQKAVPSVGLLRCTRSPTAPLRSAFTASPLRTAREGALRRRYSPIMHLRISSRLRRCRCEAPRVVWSRGTSPLGSEQSALHARRTGGGDSDRRRRRGQRRDSQGVGWGGV
jgi:hypothetical protein